MDILDNIPDVLIDLDALRAARGMSYQSLADACGISKSTICRILNGQSEPTVQQLQMIAAAVQYKPAAPEIMPNDFTQEAYMEFLRSTIQRQADENDRRVRQLQAHYNMLLRQKNREKTTWMVLALVLVATFVVLFLYDFSCLDRGWIQALQNGYKSVAHNVSLAVVSWIRNLVM